MKGVNDLITYLMGLVEQFDIRWESYIYSRTRSIDHLLTINGR